MQEPTPNPAPNAEHEALPVLDDKATSDDALAALLDEVIAEHIDARRRMVKKQSELAQIQVDLQSIGRRAELYRRRLRQRGLDG